MFGLLALAAPAAAQAPAALIEDVQGKVAGVEFMDYVAPGRVIKLGPKDSIVLGYMKSCWRETITGGTVTVGTEQSEVRQGRVERARVACGASRMQLSTREATQSAATVFRSLPGAAPAAKPPRTLVHGLSPVIEVADARGNLLIERLDEAGERVEVAVAGAALLRGRFLDLARTDVSLRPGAIYAISLGTRRVEFKVAPEAAPGATPIVGRLLRLE